MSHAERPQEALIDFITGNSVPNTGAEENRQAVERFLVDVKGYDKEEIEVDAVIQLEVDGQCFASTVDLVINVNGARFMVIKCAAGSLSSREREVVSAARLLDDYQIPLSAASDGTFALVWDTLSGDLIGKGLDALPSKSAAAASFDPAAAVQLDGKRHRRQMLIYRTYATQSCRTAAP